MGDQSVRLPSFWVYMQPPSGLSDASEFAFRMLALELGNRLAFFSDQEGPGHVRPLAALTQWDEVREVKRANAWKVRNYLTGRAPKTWAVGHAINRAMVPFDRALASLISSLAAPSKSDTSAEQTARDALGSLSEFDGRPLLAELASAVTSESGVSLSVHLMTADSQQAHVEVRGIPTSETPVKSPRKPGRPRNEKIPEIVKYVAMLREKKMPWKDIPAKVFETLDIKLDEGTLQDYLKKAKRGKIE